MARGRFAGSRVERSELTSLSDVKVAFARFMAAQGEALSARCCRDSGDFSRVQSFEICSGLIGSGSD